MAIKVKEIRIPGLPLDSRSGVFANEIAELDGVKDVLLLPDAFTKQKYVDLDYKLTIPSSSVIVTEADSFYPQFRCRGINCGMMAVALPIKSDQLSKRFIDDLLRALTFDPLYYLLYRLRLPLYKQRIDLSYDAFIDTLAGKYGGESVDIDSVKDLLNPQWLHKRTVRMRYHFGRYFGGNHYFELQKAQNNWPEKDIEKGQVVAMFHTGCQGIQSVIREDLAEQYFYQPQYVKSSNTDDIYTAFFAAQQMLENYTNAYRNATKHILDEVLERHFGIESDTLVNRGHNNVRKEQYNGENVLVYRHNAQSVGAQDIGIVSGTNVHTSYVVQGGINAPKLYNSLDHGVGSLIEQDSNISQLDEKVLLKKYKWGIRLLSKAQKEASLIHSPFVEQYWDMVEKNNWAKRVLMLKPIMNLKYEN